MARLHQGAFQGFIGKAGGLVGKKYQGQYIVSAYQPLVKNPKSTNQLNQRQNFSEALDCIKSSFKKSELETMWRLFSGGLTGRASTIKTFLQGITFYNRYTPVMFSPKAPPTIPEQSIAAGIPFRWDLFGNWLRAAATPFGYDINDANGAYEPGIKYFGADIAYPNFRVRIDYSTIVDGRLQWHTLRSEADTEITLVDKSTTPFVDTNKNGGLTSDVSTVGSGWNYVHKFTDGQVFPHVPEAVTKIVQAGAVGSPTGAKWTDSQFIVTIEFVDGTYMNSGVGNSPIIYTPADNS